MDSRKSRLLLALITATFTIVTTISVEAQLRRPQYITVKKQQKKSNLVTEPGAVYLDGLVKSPLVLKTKAAAPAYSSLDGKRWIGTIDVGQQVTLLAIGEHAYRVRGKASQGQIAGWVRKDSLTGLPDGVEEKLVKLKQRHDLVSELIDNSQIALGMTPQEVIASIGPPDGKVTETNETGSSAVYEYISYTRTPQNFVEYNQFGIAVSGVRYVEVETGRLTIEFKENLVSSISESEGINVSRSLENPIPPVVQLY